MNGRRYDFVVFSDDWGRHPSSCQHLFKRIARDHRVLWVNTLGLRAPKADAFTLFRGFEKLREWRRPLRKVEDNLWVLAPIMLPVTGDGLLGRINRCLTVACIRKALKKLNMTSPVFWTSVPTARDYLGQLGESVRVYYVTDDYSLWPGGNADLIRGADREMTRRADLVFACSDALAAGHKADNGRTILLPHAVDFDHFAEARPEPEDLKVIPRPRACFFGLIYEKIDLESLYELAVQMPSLQLVLIGPVKTNVRRLASLPNVRFLGPRPYAALPAYLHAMDIMVVPYVQDDEIVVSGPLKIRECLAVGKPTVVRAVSDVRQFSDVLHVYEDRAEFVPAVRRALAEEAGSRVVQMHARVRRDTWDARTETIMKELEAIDATKPAID